MTYLNHIKTLGHFILGLVFPVLCAFCGAEDQYLCADCARKLRHLEKQKCIVCRLPAPFGKTHTDCVSRNFPDGLVSGLPYREPAVKKLIELYKYRFVSELTEPLVQILADSINDQGLTEYFKSFTLVPVPLHAKRLRWRGFNQSELLAENLASKIGAKFDSSLVTRIKHTRPQVELTLEERKINIKQAFASQTKTGGKYLILDDVVTTGSTINEIAKILKKSGAQEVWAITLASG